MANNRMILKCSVCGKDKVIAKYYPPEGWFVFGINDAVEEINTWFDAHLHGIRTFEGPTHFIFDYELEPKKALNLN